MKKNFYKSKKIRKEDYQVQWDIYSKIIKLINLKENDKILDAGCGSGKLSEHLMSKNLYGFDFSKKAIELAKNKNYKQLYIRDIHNTGFRDKEFDVTISLQVFPYIKGQKEAFKELLRITKKQVIISVPNFNWLKIKSIFSSKFRKQYLEEIKNYSNATNSSLLKNFARENNLNYEIKYLSKQFGFIRNIFGNWLASEVVGIFKLK